MNTTNLGIMIDCSRNAVPNLSALKKFIDITSKMGYNSIQLYTEDTFEVENEPLFGFMRGRYSFDEIKENGYNLNIPRYVDTFEEEELIDIEEVQNNIARLKIEIAEAEAKMEQYLKELGLN